MATVSEQLREAREKLSLSINDVADATKIRTDHIRALEEGNYKAFAAPVYIRGFVRTYGAMLKLEATQLMADLDAELNREKKFTEPTTLSGRKRNVLDRMMLGLSRMNWVVIAVALVIGIGLLTASLTYRAWQSYKSRDPLAGLSPGLYQQESEPAGELLPLPK
ncbi:MAG: helix-turn-helix domain-containing protein [Verrucomicrobia bacterium]|nr:helix-turn-helix domain-containing protein [Verrucomicrobiota bacterium]